MPLLVWLLGSCGQPRYVPCACQKSGIFHDVSHCVASGKLRSAMVRPICIPHERDCKDVCRGALNGQLRSALVPHQCMPHERDDKDLSRTSCLVRFDHLAGSDGGGHTLHLRLWLLPMGRTYLTQHALQEAASAASGVPFPNRAIASAGSSPWGPHAAYPWQIPPRSSSAPQHQDVYNPLCPFSAEDRSSLGGEQRRHTAARLHGDIEKFLRENEPTELMIQQRQEIIDKVGNHACFVRCPAIVTLQCTLLSSIGACMQLGGPVLELCA